MLTPVVLDTNVIISALVFEGKPKQVFELLIQKKYPAIISPPLVAELIDVLRKKFRFSKDKLLSVEKNITTFCKMVYPKNQITLLKDEPDNRILEAAIEGECTYIVTGDKNFLALGHFRSIKILTPTTFYELVTQGNL